MSIFGRAYETDPRVKCFCRRKRVGEEREESIFDQTSGSKFSQNFNFKILTKLQNQYYNQTTFSFRILTKPRQLSLGRCYQNCHLFWQTKITGWPTDHQSSLKNRGQSPSSDEAGVSGNSFSRPFPRMKASDSHSRIMGMDFFIPFPFPNFGNAFFSFPSRSRIMGMGFFHSLPVPELWEWIFFIPFPFPNCGNGFF